MVSDSGSATRFFERNLLVEQLGDIGRIRKIGFPGCGFPATLANCPQNFIRRFALLGVEKGASRATHRFWLGVGRR